MSSFSSVPPTASSVVDGRFSAPPSTVSGPPTIACSQSSFVAPTEAAWDEELLWWRAAGSERRVLLHGVHCAGLAAVWTAGGWSVWGGWVSPSGVFGCPSGAYVAAAVSTGLSFPCGLGR